MAQEWGNAFEDWEVAVANKVVVNFMRSREWMRTVGQEVLVEEALSHWWEKRGTYRPDGGANKKTYMARVTQNRLIDIERKLLADAQKVKTSTGVLDRSASGETSSSEDVADPASERRLKATDIRTDLGKALGRLSPRQREICQGLMEERSPVEMAKRVKMARSTLYEEISRIRAIFKQEGLKEYISPPEE